MGGGYVVVGWLGGCWSSHWSVCCQEEKSVRQLMEDQVKIPFSGLQAMGGRLQDIMRVQFVTDVQIRSCKLRDEVTPDGWSDDVPFNQFPVGRRESADENEVQQDTWNFIQFYPEPEIAFVARLLLEECVRIAKGELARHPRVYDKPLDPTRYYVVDEDTLSGEGVGTWKVAKLSGGGEPRRLFKALEAMTRPEVKWRWFNQWKDKIKGGVRVKGPKGEKEFETPYDCAVAVYERINEQLLAQAPGDDEAVAQAKVEAAMIMLDCAPVVEYGTLLRTPGLLEDKVFGKRYYEALKRSGDDDDRKQQVRSRLEGLPRQIVGWVMEGAVVGAKIVHPKLPYLIRKDEKTGTKEKLEQRLRDVVEEVTGTFTWLADPPGTD